MRFALPQAARPLLGVGRQRQTVSVFPSNQEVSSGFGLAYKFADAGRLTPHLCRVFCEKHTILPGQKSTSTPLRLFNWPALQPTRCCPFHQLLTFALLQVTKVGRRVRQHVNPFKEELQVYFMLSMSSCYPQEAFEYYCYIMNRCPSSRQTGPRAFKRQHCH